jgi:acyl-CoA thioesterase
MARDPQELAEACAWAMWSEDIASQSLGMRIDAIAPGAATLSMMVTETMVNGHGLCHGGYIFTLADSALAFASNSYNQSAVAQHCQITFLAPGRLGDRLTAVSMERHRSGRNGIYDVTVRNQDGIVVAEFRGSTRTIEGQLVPDSKKDGP